MVSTSDFDSDSVGSIPASVANWSADEPMGVDDDTSHKVHQMYGDFHSKP